MMSIFSKLYDRVISWSRHRHAVNYLAFLSFIESSVFPIPPDVMLAPMALAKPSNAYKYAFITTLFSCLGGLFGYLLGYLAFEPIVLPALHYFGYFHDYERIVVNFNKWGFWIIVIAGATPIPYKLFTVAAGFVRLGLPGFFFASVVGRGARFFLVSALIAVGGTKMAGLIRRYVDITGWLIVFGIALWIGFRYFMG